MYMYLHSTDTINPLLSPPGACLFQTHLRGGLGGLFNLAKVIKNYNGKWKSSSKTVGSPAAKDQNQKLI